MPAKDTLLIGPRHLQSCTDVSYIINLFRILRYPVPQTVTPLSIDETLLSGALRDAIKERYQIATLSRTTGVFTVTLFVLHDTLERASAIRAISQAWVKKAAGEHLLVFAYAGQREGESTLEFSQMVFVNPRRLTEGTHVRIKLHKLLVDRANPTRHDVVTVNALAILTPTLGPEQLFAQHCEAFDVELITKAIIFATPTQTARKISCVW